MKLEGFGHRRNNRYVNFVFNMLFKVEIVKLIDVGIPTDSVGFRRK